MAYDVPPIERADVIALGEISLANVDPHIEIAKLIVDENLLDKGLSDALLKIIWKYLAAHFALIKEGELKSETIGPIASGFNRMTGLGLKSTTPGQQAIFLDTSGKLYTLDNQTIETLTPKRQTIAVF